MPEQVTPTELVSFQKEDVLQHLRRAETRNFKKGQAIFDKSSKEAEVYLVQNRIVAIETISEDGRVVYLGFPKVKDELIINETLVGGQRKTAGRCLTKEVEVMVWPVKDMEIASYREPRLAAGLINVLAQEKEETDTRQLMSATMRIGRRLAAMLAVIASKTMELEDADELREGEDAIVLDASAFTHDTLAHFVWTSREIITHYMNTFRRAGWIRYSRKGILICGVDQMLDYSLRRIELPEGAEHK